jgi:hypothetical protein
VSEATVAAKTVGQDIDAEIAVIKAKLAVLEAEGKTDWADLKAWVGTNWPHFVSWAVTGAVAVKTGVLADVAKLL